MGGRFNNGPDYDDSPYQSRGPTHQPTRPVDKDKTETELINNIKKATSPEETAPSGFRPVAAALTIHRAEACPQYVSIGLHRHGCAGGSWL